MKWGIAISLFKTILQLAFWQLLIMGLRTSLI